jgi:hypothetical protein
MIKIGDLYPKEDDIATLYAELIIDNEIISRDRGYFYTNSTDFAGNTALSIKDPSLATDIVFSKWEELPRNVKRIFLTDFFTWLPISHLVAFDDQRNALLAEQNTDRIAEAGDEDEYFDNYEVVNIWIQYNQEQWEDIGDYVNFCQEFGRCSAEESQRQSIVDQTITCQLEFDPVRLAVRCYYTVENGLVSRGFSTIESFLSPAKSVLDTVYQRTIEAIGSKLENDDSYLRLYVPDEKYQTDQIGSFVRLFENYLNRVESIPMRVDSVRSGKGTFFIFKLPTESDPNSAPDLQATINNFEHFMEMCSHDPLQAQTLLTSKGVPVAQAGVLITKYSKQYQRMINDCRQEAEQKQLLLRQTMDNEILELRMGGQISSYEIFPAKTLGSAIFGAGSGPVMVNVIGSEQCQVIANAIAQKIYGSGIVYTEGEEQLRKVIEEKTTSDREAISLKSDLDQVKDETADPQVRKSAKEQLVGFFQRNGKEMGDMAFRAILDAAIKAGTGG